MLIFYHLNSSCYNQHSQYLKTKKKTKHTFLERNCAFLLIFLMGVVCWVFGFVFFFSVVGGGVLNRCTLPEVICVHAISNKNSVM